MKWWAIPCRPTGEEYMGTAGVLTGEYLSRANFLRYNVSKNHNTHPAYTRLGDADRPTITYNLYIRTTNGEWLARGSVEF